MWSERVKMKSVVDYYKEYYNVKIKCDYMIVNLKFDYELSSECKKCRNKVICDKWIYRMNIKSSCVIRSKEVIVNSKDELEKLKLNVKYVTLTKKRSSRVNKELKRRIEQMKSIPVLTL